MKPLTMLTTATTTTTTTTTTSHRLFAFRSLTLQATKSGSAMTDFLLDWSSVHILCEKYVTLPITLCITEKKKFGINADKNSPNFTHLCLVFF